MSIVELNDPKSEPAVPFWLPATVIPVWFHVAHVGIIGILIPTEAPEEEKTINVDYDKMRKKIIQAIVVVVDIVVVVVISMKKK